MLRANGQLDCRDCLHYVNWCGKPHLNCGWDHSLTGGSWTHGHMYTWTKGWTAHAYIALCFLTVCPAASSSRCLHFPIMTDCTLNCEPEQTLSPLSCSYILSSHQEKKWRMTIEAANGENEEGSKGGHRGQGRRKMGEKRTVGWIMVSFPFLWIVLVPRGAVWATWVVVWMRWEGEREWGEQDRLHILSASLALH